LLKRFRHSVDYKPPQAGTELSPPKILIAQEPVASYDRLQKQRDAEYQQYLAKRKAETEKYNKAQSACLEGRGYSVR
jgi:hypothetical protein